MRCSAPWQSISFRRGYLKFLFHQWAKHRDKSIGIVAEPEVGEVNAINGAFVVGPVDVFVGDVLQVFRIFLLQQFIILA